MREAGATSRKPRAAPAFSEFGHSFGNILGTLQIQKQEYALAKVRCGRAWKASDRRSSERHRLAAQNRGVYAEAEALTREALKLNKNLYRHATPWRSF